MVRLYFPSIDLFFSLPLLEIQDSAPQGYIVYESVGGDDAVVHFYLLHTGKILSIFAQPYPVVYINIQGEDIARKKERTIEGLLPLLQSIYKNWAFGFAWHVRCSDSHAGSLDFPPSPFISLLFSYFLWRGCMWRCYMCRYYPEIYGI